MAMIRSRNFEVGEATQAGEARRGAMMFARELGFDDFDAGRVGIVVTEAATNLVKHAGGGRVLVQSSGNGGGPGLTTLVLDHGPGMKNLSEMMRDGFSSAGTPGTGLGAIARQSTRFEVYSVPGKGTAMISGIWPRVPGPADGTVRVGGVSVAVRGEEKCGDTWSVLAQRGVTRVLVADGVGHGPAAFEAAACSALVFENHPETALEELVTRMHEALRATRGAAIVVVELMPDRELVRCCGIGNVSGRIFSDHAERHLVSHFGTLGHDVRRIQEFQYPWPRGATLVLHSDGLATHWKLDDYPGLAGRDPTLTAAVLFRDHARGRDDCTVVVARNGA